MRFVYILLLISISFGIKSQSNLVMNGSFEQYNPCAEGIFDSQFPLYEWNKIHMWNTSDYYNSEYRGCYLPSKYSALRYGENVEILGQDGSGFVGMYPCCLSPKRVIGDMCTRGYTEPIVGRIVNPVEVDKSYKASFSLYLPTLSSCNVKSFSIVLLKDTLILSNSGPNENFITLYDKLYSVDIQILQFDISSLITKRNEWVKFNHVFKANGNTAFLLIGFFPDFTVDEKNKLDKLLTKNDNKFFNFLRKNWTSYKRPFDALNGGLNESYIYLDAVEIVQIVDFN